jgi:hypothetical protein
MAQRLQKSFCRSSRQEICMSTFDNPFDPARKLSGGCGCGGHASDAEHHHAQDLQLRAAIDSEQAATTPHHDPRHVPLVRIASLTEPTAQAAR